MKRHVFCCHGFILESRTSTRRMKRCIAHTVIRRIIQDGRVNTSRSTWSRLRSTHAHCASETTHLSFVLEIKQMEVWRSRTGQGEKPSWRVMRSELQTLLRFPHLRQDRDWDEYEYFIRQSDAQKKNESSMVSSSNAVMPMVVRGRGSPRWGPQKNKGNLSVKKRTNPLCTIFNC